MCTGASFRKILLCSSWGCIIYEASALSVSNVSCAPNGCEPAGLHKQSYNERSWEPSFLLPAKKVTFFFVVVKLIICSVISSMRGTPALNVCLPFASVPLDAVFLDPALPSAFLWVQQR